MSFFEWLFTTLVRAYFYYILMYIFLVDVYVRNVFVSACFVHPWSTITLWNNCMHRTYAFDLHTVLDWVRVCVCVFARWCHWVLNSASHQRPTIFHNHIDRVTVCSGNATDKRQIVVHVVALQHTYNASFVSWTQISILYELLLYIKRYAHFAIAWLRDIFQQIQFSNPDLLLPSQC